MKKTQNKNVNIYIVLHDNEKGFEDLYSRVYRGHSWYKLDNDFRSDKYTKADEILYDSETKSIYLSGVSFDDSIDIIAIINEIKNKTAFFFKDNTIINNVFIRITEGGISKEQLTTLSKKYCKETTDIHFYNFGKTYILNKTFFDSDYSVFENNIAHEAINAFETDNGDRYFYLCKDGKLTDFIYDYEALVKLPKNYIDINKATLINFSKMSEGDKVNYSILQRVSNICPTKFAFEKERNEESYKEITYCGINLCEIFKDNAFMKISEAGMEDRTKKDPVITFTVDNENSVQKPKSLKTFTRDDEKFDNLSSSSCRQFVIEGTKLYNSFEDLIGEDSEWEIDRTQTLKEYINSYEYKKDYEESFLLKVIGKERKETYYSKLLTFVFANSLEIIEKFLKNGLDMDVKIKKLTGIYNEKYNMDVCFTFIDENEAEHMVVIENKIDASFTPAGNKSLIDYFNKSDSELVTTVEEEFEEYKTKHSNISDENQLTKYYLISRVLSNKSGIDAGNLRYIVLAPEYKKDYCEKEKEKYYYGESYTVISYSKLKDAIDEVINNKCSPFHSLRDDTKDIIVQFNRSLWPYIGDSCSYYKRIMCNRFARAAEQCISDGTRNNTLK